MPSIKNNFLMQPGSPWHENIEACEVKLKWRRENDYRRWMEKTHRPPPLSVSDRVAVQNMHSNNPTKWEQKTMISMVEDWMG